MVHKLQSLILAAGLGSEGLYWRQVDPAGEPLPAAGPRSIAPGCRLRLDTFLNSFYENYWRHLTGLKTLTLEIVTSGPCRIHLVRREAGKGDAVLATASARGTHNRSILTVSLADLPCGDTVLHAEVEALDETASIHEGAWLTEDMPHNPVRLAIVICSYGREEMLVATLRRLGPVVARSPEIIELLIVRQGKTDLRAFPPFSSLISDGIFEGKLRLIEQDNFGGSGGFARGMLESLETDATDILLLDDDISIEPTIVERLTALLAHVETPTTIGGQMLDLDHPNFLYASHERVKFESLELHNPYKGLDLSSAQVADLFGQVQHGNYNAWWFCSIPASTCRAIGLPMPMFVRHDDVEYGMRTVASGAAIATMPGLFVWHESFLGKLNPVYVYYERRNFLIAAALHGPARPLRWARRHWSEAWQALRQHRYEYCWALCRAVDDYLLGPRAVFSDIPERHRRLSADQARFTLLTMAGHRRRKVGTTGGRRANSESRAEARLDSAFRHLAFTIARTSLALLWGARRAASAYRSEAATCSATPYWRQLLALPPSHESPS